MKKAIDLGEDETIVEFKISGKTFCVFPLEEIDIINELAMSLNDGKEISGVPFCKVIQSHLKATHGIEASLEMSAKWYKALSGVAKEQEDFFAGSPASPGSTDSSPAAGEVQQAGQAASVETSSTPSSESSTRSSRKKSPKSS